MSTTKKILLICGGVIFFTILLEIIFVDYEGEYWWHGTVGFDAVFGLLGCLALILLAKNIGKRFLQRNEDYYDRGEEQ